MKSAGRLLCVLAIILASAVTWINLSWDTIKTFTNSPSESRIDYYLTGFTLISTDSEGNVKYNVTAQHLTYNQQGGASEIYRPFIEARSEKGELMTISSQKAIQQAKSGNMIFSGDTKVHKPLFNGSPEFLLTTENLTYKPSTQTISSTEDISLISSQGYLKGTGFETKLDEQELRILSNVQAEFQPIQ